MEKAIDAINAGNNDDALRYIQDMSKNWMVLHDRYVAWGQILLNFIAVRLGEDAVLEAHKAITDYVYGPMFGKWNAQSHEEIVANFVRMSDPHQHKYHVEEDEEKTVITLDLCGSGGRAKKEGVFKKIRRLHQRTLRLVLREGGDALLLLPLSGARDDMGEDGLPCRPRLRGHRERRTVQMGHPKT